MDPYNQDIDVVRSQARKAATILLALGGSIGSKLFKDFEIDEIRNFAFTAGEIDQIDTNALIDFVDELSNEMNLPEPLLGGEVQTRALLDEALPLDRLKKVFGEDSAALLNIWTQFTIENEGALTPYLLDEHPQTIAYIVQNLNQDLAPRIVSTLPKEIRDSVVRRLLNMKPVNKTCDQIVQLNLQNDILTQVADNSKSEGRSKLAKLLNKMDKDQVEIILDSMQISLPGEAAAIRKMLFSFEDIYRLSQKDRLIMFDKVQTEKVMLALRGVTAELKEIVLSSLGARARRMIEAELGESSPDVTNEVVAARQAIADTVLKLAAAGTIEILEAESEAGAESTKKVA